MDNQNPFGPPVSKSDQPEAEKQPVTKLAEPKTPPSPQQTQQPSANGAPSAMVGPAQPEPNPPKPASAQVTTPTQPAPSATQTKTTPPLAPPIKNNNAAVIRRTNRPKILKPILIILGTLAVVAAIYFIFFYRASIEINPSPAPDKIILNGKEVAPGVYKVMPGKNSIEFSKEGYTSFAQTQTLNAGEKITLNFNLQKEVEPTLISPGGKSVTNSYNKKVINYISKEGYASFLVPSTEAKNVKSTVLSNSIFSDARKILFSDNNTFALSLGTSGLKVSDFKKSDTTSQLEATLPPEPSLISDVTWNNGTSSFISEANSQIIYDLKTPQNWMLLQADRQHKKSEILMYLETDKFSALNMDWGENKTQVLLTGGEIGILDLTTRTYEKIDEGKNFKSASWGPKGNLAVALDRDNKIFFVKDKKLVPTGQTATNGIVSWVGENEILIFQNSRPTKINFDTNEKISYAEIKGISKCSSAVINSGKIYFADIEGVKSASLVSNVYEREGK